MESYIAGVLTALFALLIWGGIFGAMLSFWFLAQHDLFFTPNVEGTAKAILHNGKFHRCIGALKGHAFSDETGNSGENSWDVIEIPSSLANAKVAAENKWQRFTRIAKEKARIIFGFHLVGGLEWVGIPPFYSVYTYQFKWSVLKIEKSGGKAPETKSELLSYIFLKQVVYLVVVTRAETSELIPMDASVVLTISVVNPYKALFAVHNWLEAISDQMGATIRAIIGKHTFRQLTEAKETASGELKKDLRGRAQKIEKNYGIRILISQIQSIDPSDEVAQKIRGLSLEGYTAEQKATAIRTLAEAEKERIAAVYGTVIEYGEAGLQIRFDEALERTNVSVITTGRGVIPSFQIPNHGARQEKNNDARSASKNKE